MSKVLVPFCVKCGVLKGVDIVVRIRVFSIHVDKQACVVKNNDVVHGIYFLLSIKPKTDDLGPSKACRSQLSFHQ
jgi:hypothetical protein